MSGISTATWEHFCASVANPSPLVLNHQQQGKGDPLLLIHGFGESLYTWRHLVPGLAQRHHVIAIDLKGFGASPSPTTIPTTYMNRQGWCCSSSRITTCAGSP